METYLDKLVLLQPLRDPAIQHAIRALGLPEGSHGLDAGCGTGSHTLLLAEVVGPDGHVTGLDLSAELVAYGQVLAKQSVHVKQVSFRRGNVNELPFDNDTFDWAWSVDCVGHPTVGEPLTALQELARVVRPGGQVAVLGYSTQMLLPGYPLLEARLNATASAMTYLAKGRRPEAHLLRALGWFREVGLAEPAASTVVGTVCAPFGDVGWRRIETQARFRLEDPGCWVEQKSRVLLAPDRESKVLHVYAILPRGDAY